MVASIYVSSRAIGQTNDYEDEETGYIPQKDCPDCGQSYDMEHHICPFCLYQQGIDKILQTNCPKCGQSHDMDYPVCPFCKHRYVIEEESSFTKKKPAISKKSCPECGAEHDADYHTCPFCEYKYK